MDETEEQLMAFADLKTAPRKVEVFHHEDESCTRTLEPDAADQTLLEEDGLDCTQDESSLAVLNRSISFENVEEAVRDSPFIFLPNEVTLDILRQLDVADLKAAFLVCRLWSMERWNEQLWKTVVFRCFGEWASLKPGGMSWKMLALSCDGAPEPGPEARLGRLVITAESLPHANGEYVGQLSEGQQHGLGIMRYEAGHTYSGGFARGHRQGMGEYRWKNGNVYSGEWDDDKQNGMGEFRWNDGDYYKGEWKQDHRHGKGTYTWPKGSYYEGEFDMNDLHRHGRYTWKNGYYEGGWRNSTRHGKGVIRWTNGNSFDGEFANNAKCGHGVYRWSDGATYSGTWKADDRCGSAVTVWANGMSYVGHYVRDLRNGKGTLRWPDGASFEGTWRNGGRWGRGTFTPAPGDGQPVEQVWHEEEKIQYSKGIPAKFPK